MHRFEYKQARVVRELHEEQLDVIKKKHMGDPSLFHPIGEDRYCLYCEQYQKILKQLKPIIEKIALYEETHEVKEPVIQQVTSLPRKDKRIYRVYSFLFKDGSEYLVYTFSEAAGCRLLGKELSTLRKQVRIAKAYYSSIYLEREDGGVLPLSLCLRELPSKRSSVLAEKGQTRAKGTGNCYNEKPFSFFKYKEGQFDTLQSFCGESFSLQKTKKFVKTGKVAMATTRGMIALEYGQILMKLFPGTFLVISEEEFEEYFVEDEALVWMQKES